MKFLTDCMLGRLTRFLRIFGYDTIFAKDLEKEDKVAVPDDDLVEFAQTEKRIIITKDKLLSKKASASSLFLEGEDVYDYLRQMKVRFKSEFQFELKNARCSVCNSTLNRVKNKEEIKELVSEGTYENIEEFYQCSNANCKKVYWYGTHIEDILSKIKHIEVE